MPSQWAKKANKAKAAKSATGKVRMTRRKRENLADTLRSYFGAGAKVK
jgi:hypothetical protein